MIRAGFNFKVIPNIEEVYDLIMLCGKVNSLQFEQSENRRQEFKPIFPPLKISPDQLDNHVHQIIHEFLIRFGPFPLIRDKLNDVVKLYNVGYILRILC